MTKIQELDERREKALYKMKKTLTALNETTDQKRKARLNEILNVAFAELRSVAQERILYIGGFIK